MDLRSTARFFVVIGAQRTGTNLLRELLNTSPHLGMLGEVLTPHSAPAHFANFLLTLEPDGYSMADIQSADLLLDHYIAFIERRIRNFWRGDDKSRVAAIGIDIKYNQLNELRPVSWSRNTPYLLDYLKRRSAVVIHTIRDNVVLCAISASIATQRKVWHNYDGQRIARAFRIEPHACLTLARELSRSRQAFVKDAAELRIVSCHYEDLVEALSKVPPGHRLPEIPGPLREIADAIGIPFGFRHQTRLQRAITVPYAKLIENYRELVTAVRASEFAHFAADLV